ncbi:MAG: hypothetical protein VX955_11180, partial [Pseudomonadota bacterium]|nr:hypothetical protein [Pseudomonadota bacterium]
DGILCPDTKDVYRVSTLGSSRIRIEVRRRDGGEAVLPFKVTAKERENPCQGDDDCPASWVCEERACTATNAVIEAAQVGANRDTAIIEFPGLGDTLISPVDYFIELDGLGDRLEYSITASVVREGANGLGGACFPDAREPDNNRDQAELLRQGISEDSPINGTLCGDDKDFFAIELGAADQLRVDLAVTGGDAADVELYVFRDAPGSNQADGLYPDNSFSNPANEDFVPGRYIILVQSAAGGDSALDYTLSVFHRPGAVNCPDMDQSGSVVDVADNPNVDPMRDGITEIGDALGIQLAICDPAVPDVDVFCFEAQPGETLGAAVVGDKGGDLIVDWRNADNRRV